MALARRIFKLKGIIQHYSWGGYDFIPRLLNKKNQEQKPYAEYWMGAHPNHSAMVENEKEEALIEMIARYPEDVLGKPVAEKFSTIPYLFKVLDVRQMLSIQVHPSRKEAEICFEQENKKGIPINAPHRNYKDKNHKPELMVALSDFYLLHGFKSKKELQQVLQAKEELHFLNEIFQSGGYKALYEEVMLMDQDIVNERLHPLVQKILPLYEKDVLEKDKEDFWAARAAISFCKNNNYDRGIFSIYLFNLVHLKKDEGIFQPAGMPHAYLEGQNVEIMANSDNVLRAGLTDKHIDVAELMNHVKFEATIPKVLNPSSRHRVFSSPAEEFQLEEYRLKKDASELIHTSTAEIFLVLDGALEVHSAMEVMNVSRGECFLAAAGSPLSIKALSELNLFRVTVP